MSQRKADKILRALAPLREHRLLVGVSGGPDSVALLDALVRLGHRPHICHLNHKLRGAESDADAEFVRRLAGKYGLTVTIEETDVGAAFLPRSGITGRDRNVAPTKCLAPTKRKSKGLEDACRQARLAFFEGVAKETGITTIALAHTADDQVETFLMRLIRGAGTTGLGGMREERQIGKLRVIRPLLGVTRKEVFKYLGACGLKYRLDASNQDRRFLRNRIRHELLPLLERDFNPGIRRVLRRTAELLRAEAEADPVAAERRMVRGLSFEQVEELRKLARKEKVGLPLAGEWELKVPGETAIGELGGRFVAAGFTPANSTGQPHAGVKPAATEEVFDADTLGGDLLVRTWREGDRFQPLGMKGEKKLQDFYVDEKVPRRQRGCVPLVCAADGRIAWVVGYRMAEPFKVTPATKRVLRIRFRDC